MKRWWAAWVELWDRREDATALALVRIFVGVVLLYDYVEIWRLDLADVLFTTDGLALRDGRGYLVAATIAAALIAVGGITRVACVVFVIASAQLAHHSPNAERGIDVILRIVVCMLALSQSHARWSLDAIVRARLGRPMAREVPAWPRYLLLLQLVWIYFAGALNKGGASWFPHGDFTALANILGDPHVARFEQFVPLLLTQIATAIVIAFEFTAPIYLVAYWRRWNRVRWIWIAIGVGFHAGIAITMRLGIFPFGMLALYPVLLRPEELTRSPTRT